MSANAPFYVVLYSEDTDNDGAKAKIVAGSLKKDLAIRAMKTDYKKQLKIIKDDFGKNKITEAECEDECAYIRVSDYENTFSWEIIRVVPLEK